MSLSNKKDKDDVILKLNDANDANVEFDSYYDDFSPSFMEKIDAKIDNNFCVFLIATFISSGLFFIQVMFWLMLYYS